FFVAFPTAAGALEAASEAQGALELPVRMGLHTGTPLLTGEGYVGADVHRAARIAAAGHGGQVLVSATTAALVGGALTPLGEHRRRICARPAPLFRRGTGESPPLKTISNTNVPRPASSFVGREREVADVTALFRSGSRLVTLTGPGGSGKTRLAIESAAELLDDLPAGPFLVGLASVRGSGPLVPRGAEVLRGNGGLHGHNRQRE